MAIVEQSTGLVKSAVSKVIEKLIGDNSSRGYLYLMKGQVPTSLSNILNPSRYRVDDRLVQWNRNQIVIAEDGLVSTTASFAFKSSSATWFHWYRIDGEFVYQAIGKVNGTGLGGDIELTSTFITEGNSYSISDLGVSLNKEFSDIGYNIIPAPTPAPTPALGAALPCRS